MKQSNSSTIEVLRMIDWQTTSISTSMRPVRLENTVTERAEQKVAALLKENPDTNPDTIRQTVWTALEEIIRENPVECIRFREN